MSEPNNTETGKSNEPKLDNELPRVESPSISPAEDKKSAPAADANTLPALFVKQPQESPKAADSGVKLSRRVRQRALMAATIFLGAGIGAVIGALASGHFNPPTPAIDTAGREERAGMQRTIAHLNKEVSALKFSMENSARSTSGQVAKIADRIDRIERAETTASITKTAAATPALPVTKTAAAMPAPVPAAAPAPAPAPVAAAPATTPVPQPRPPIVTGWSVREARDGMVFVENRGDTYRVTPGVPLPGLGRVEDVKREGGHVIVVTQKGVITTQGPHISYNRPRMYYPPFFRPY